MEAISKLCERLMVLKSTVCGAPLCAWLCPNSNPWVGAQVLLNNVAKL